MRTKTKQYNFSDCQADYLAILDEMYGSQKYCGNSLPPNQISSSNEIFIHFKTDDIERKRGFKLEYEPYGK